MILVILRTFPLSSGYCFDVQEAEMQAAHPTKCTNITVTLSIEIHAWPGQGPHKSDSPVLSFDHTALKAEVGLYQVPKAGQCITL